MRKQFLYFFVIGLIFMSEAQADKDIQELITKGGTGKYHCAYQRKQASQTCTVIVKKEMINHPAFVMWHGKPDRGNVITIQWPDGDESRYTETDSGEMINLGNQKGFGDYHLSGDEVEQDWSRGFVIEKSGAEYIRLW